MIMIKMFNKIGNICGRAMLWNSNSISRGNQCICCCLAAYVSIL